jgi:phospholipid/cholesterol/gamma-HCH transport system substrate-binding protein
VKPFRERNPIYVGLISVAVLTIAMAFAFSLNRFTFLRRVHDVKAEFADAAGLTPDNEVRVAGLKVGKVKSVELAEPDRRGVTDRVVVVMEVSNGLELGDFTEGEIKLKTILGSKFVELVPKGSDELEGVIPLARTRIPFELYEVTNRTVGSLGEVDAKALNDGLRELAELFDDPEGNLGRAMDGLSKATKGLKDRQAEFEDLIRSGGEILETLGSRSEALGRIFDSGAELLAALSARRDALARFVSGSNDLAAELSDLLDSTRADLDPALEDLHRTLLVVRKDIKPLEDALKTLGPGAKSFGSVFLQGHWGDIWIQTILDLPIPPILPVGTGLDVPISADGTTEANARSPTAAELAAILMGGAA